MKYTQKKALRWMVAMGLTMTAFSWGNVEAMPTGGEVRSGEAEIKTSGQSMDIDQKTPRVALDWTGFDIAKGEMVRFNQNPSDIAVNRILGNKASEIYGNLQAGGTVFLLNPQGILFGQGAQVDVGNLIASTAQVDDSFMTGFSAGGDVSLNLGEASKGKVINAGEIKAQGGLVVLHAANVENNGSIKNDGGKVSLSAVKNLKLAVDTAGKINFETSGKAANAHTLNAGKIQADGGYVVMTAKSAGDMLSEVVNNTGIIEAKTASINDKGEILLDGGDCGTVNVSGQLNASGKDVEQKQDGGKITIKGKGIIVQENAKLLTDGTKNGGKISFSNNDTLSVFNNAVISVAGNQGGTIDISGNSATINNAKLLAEGTQNGGTIKISGDKLSVKIDAELNASGETGNGGTIQMFGKDATISDNGKLLAEGAKNGGQIQFSGNETISVSEQSQISAKGDQKVGELLVDSPVAIHIGDKAPANDAEKLDLTENTQDSYVGENRHITPKDLNSLKNDGVVNNYIKADYISYLLSNGTSVTINAVDRNTQSETSNALGRADIYVEKPIEKSQDKMTGEAGEKYGEANSDATLTLKAQRNIYVNSPITAKDGKLNVDLHADTSGVGKGMVVLNSDVQTNGGDFTVGTGQKITDGTVGTLIGSVTSKDMTVGTRDKKDITINTKGGNVNFYGDVGLGIEDGRFSINTTAGTPVISTDGIINIGGNLGSMNTYKFYINSDKRGASVKDNPDMKALAEFYYDNYLKKIAWLDPDELGKAQIAPEYQALYDSLRERCFGSHSQLKDKVDVPEKNSQAERDAIKKYYVDNVYLGTTLETPKEFGELTTTDSSSKNSEYTTLAKHILTAYHWNETDNRESILTQWELARIAAQGNTEGNAQLYDTYLATITTPLEDWVVSSQLAPLISTDANEELLLGGRANYNGMPKNNENRTFSWHTGPEKGQVFYETGGKAGEGVTSTNMYQGWSHDKGYNDPNNDCKYEQPFVAIGSRVDTSWADVENQKNNVRGFVQEINLHHADVELISDKGNITIGGNVGKSAPLNSLTIKTAGQVKTGGGSNPGTMEKNKSHQYQVNPEKDGTYTGMIEIDGQLNVVGNAGVDIGDHITADSVNIHSKGDIAIRGIDAEKNVKLVTEGSNHSITMKKKLDSINMNDGINTEAKSLDAVIIDAHDGRFINETTGTNAITTGAGGRWKIYSNSPDVDAFGTNLNSNTYALWGRDDSDKYAYTTFADDDSTTAGRYIFAIRPVITLTADEVSKVYGDALNLAGWKSVTIDKQYSAVPFTQDTIAKEDVQALSDGQAAKAGVGSYAIEGSGFDNTSAAKHGYVLKTVGTVNVTPRPLDVAVELTGTYGSDKYTNKVVSVENLTAWDNVTDVAYTLTDSYRSQIRDGAVTGNAGDYENAVKATGVMFEDATVAKNYSINYKNAKLTIQPREVVLDLTGQGISLDSQNIHVNGMSYESQLVNGDTLATAPVVTYRIGSTQGWGTYGIDLYVDGAKVNSGDVSGNYRFNYTGVYKQDNIERPQFDFVSTTPRRGTASYDTNTEPRQSSVEKVLGLTMAKLPVMRDLHNKITRYGTYQLTVAPDKVTLELADKDVPLRVNSIHDQYREYTKNLTTKRGAADFKLSYDGSVFALHPIGQEAEKMLEAGDAAHNVDVVSQALYTAFHDMGLTLDDLDAVYVCFA